MGGVDLKNNLVLDYEKKENEMVIKIIGEIDIFSATAFKKDIYTIIQKGERNIIFDCVDLKYIDSTGLGVFVSILKESKQQESDIKLTNLRSNILKLFVITGLDTIFNIEKEVI